MKHFSKIFLALALVFGFNTIQAQDSDNPWAIGIGTNVVDFYPTGEDAAPLGGFGDEYFNSGDHWNVLPAVSKLSVSRYIGAGFVGELSGSVNQIEHFGDMGVSDLSYYSTDLGLDYSLRALLNDGWLDPVVGIGAGYNWIGDGNDMLSDADGVSLNGKLGLNFWFSDNIALAVESKYKKMFDVETATHFQHSAGVKFIFGGKDTDGDGVYDKDDECPEQPGLAEFNGCPDSDGDGIEDRQDACPNEAGLAEFDGCPDTDGDGIADPDDECPEEAGTAEMNGCPDTDGDGVADNEDECPEEAGPAENDGCPWPDTDGDGVLDKDDECPEEAGPAASNGCPEPTAEVISELNEYSKTVLFDFNKATIRKESESALQSIVDIMKEYPKTIFHIEGHTDSVGSESYNEKLSRERAASVAKWLSENGVPQNRLTSEGYGESRPIASNSTDAGRQENRRVEISLDKNREMKDASEE